MSFDNEDLFDVDFEVDEERERLAPKLEPADVKTKEVLEAILSKARGGAYNIYILSCSFGAALSIHRKLSKGHRYIAYVNGEKTVAYVKLVGGKDVEIDALEDSKSGSMVYLIYLLPELYYYEAFEYAKESDVLKNMNTMMLHSIVYGNPAVVVITSQPAQLKEISRLFMLAKQENLYLEDAEARGSGYSSPPNAIELSSDASFKDLVLPEYVKNYIEVSVISPARVGFSEVQPIMLIGVEGSGKKTLASAIAKELGGKAYAIIPDTMFSKYVGDTEKIFASTLASLNDSGPCVVVISNIENMMSESGEDSGVAARARSIIARSINSRDRRYISIVTISEPSRVPMHVVSSNIYGVIKIPIFPPVKVDERFEILVRQISKHAARFGMEFTVDQTMREAIYQAASRSVFYTPRELEAVARIAVYYSYRIGKKRIDKEAVQIAPDYVGVNLESRIPELARIVSIMRKIGIPKKLEPYVESLRAEVNVVASRYGIKLQQI